jgi:hypothetical protein
MEARANIASADGKHDKKKLLDKLCTSEARAAMYRKIQAVRGKFNSSGFTSIEVPSSWPPAHSHLPNAQALPDPKKATEWKTVDLPDEIVYYLLLRNRRHFGQAQGTPFTTPTFTTHIDWAASTKTSELILNGDFNTDELSDLQKPFY